VSAVAADQLHKCARQRNLENARVRGVGHVEADHLPGLRAKQEIGLAVDEQHIPEAAHRRVGRLGPAERGDLAVLEQDVVER
jgi:hypothetical protein